MTNRPSLEALRQWEISQLDQMFFTAGVIKPAVPPQVPLSFSEAAARQRKYYDWLARQRKTNS